MSQREFDGVNDIRSPGLSLPRLSIRLNRGVAFFGGCMFLVLVFLAVFPGIVAPYDPTETVARPFLPPGQSHLLGTNDIGQDLFSELVWGTRVSLLTGIAVSLITVTIGSILGLFAGYYNTLGSSIVMRLVDLTLALPFLPLVILLGAYLGASWRNVIIILILVSWAAPARLIRSRVLETVNQPYVESAIALGSRDRRIIFRHVWPAARSIAMVQVVLIAASAILAEASLSFLGLGDPSTKSWGTMLYFAQASGAFLGDAWLWWVLPAGLMITLTILSLVLIGYALEHRLEPRLSRR